MCASHIIHKLSASLSPPHVGSVAHGCGLFFNPFLSTSVPGGSGVERMDSIRFLVGCKRQLNQAVSVLFFLLGFLLSVFMIFARAVLIVLRYSVFFCVLSVVLAVSTCQVNG